MIADVGVENLVDDDGADDEGYQNPQAEDKADGGGLNPVRRFPAEIPSDLV